MIHIGWGRYHVKIEPLVKSHLLFYFHIESGPDSYPALHRRGSSRTDLKARKATLAAGRLTCGKTHARNRQSDVF